MINSQMIKEVAIAVKPTAIACLQVAAISTAYAGTYVATLYGTGKLLGYLESRSKAAKAARQAEIDREAAERARNRKVLDEMVQRARNPAPVHVEPYLQKMAFDAFVQAFDKANGLDDETIIASLH